MKNKIKPIADTIKWAIVDKKTNRILHTIEDSLMVYDTRKEARGRNYFLFPIAKRLTFGKIRKVIIRDAE
jgi:hypothetical protein